MTCAHVLGLVDAGPFADYPRAHLDAAWEHARQCPTCGPALEAARALTADLAVLPEPVPLSNLRAAVISRIARAERGDAIRRPLAMQPVSVVSAARGWAAWATAFGGLAAGLALVLSGDRVPFDVLSVRFGWVAPGLVSLPSATVWALVLAAGLVLYVTGLFAPLAKSDESG